jgi:hypothetical protein
MLRSDTCRASDGGSAERPLRCARIYFRSQGWRNGTAGHSSDRYGQGILFFRAILLTCSGVATAHSQLLALSPEGMVTRPLDSLRKGLDHQWHEDNSNAEVIIATAIPSGNNLESAS